MVGLACYLFQMKPSNHFHDLQHSLDTGKEVAKMVRKFKLEKKAVLNSFDYFKTMAAKQENPDVVVGNLFSKVSSQSTVQQIITTIAKTIFKKKSNFIKTRTSNLAKI